MREREVPKGWPWIVVGVTAAGVMMAVGLGLLLQVALWLVG